MAKLSKIYVPMSFKSKNGSLLGSMYKYLLQKVVKQGPEQGNSMEKSTVYSQTLFLKF